MLAGINKQKYSVLRGLYLALTLAFSVTALAQQGPNTLNVSGGLFLPSGLPVTSANVNFRIEIYDKASTCILYTENHLGVDLSGSKGGFALPIGRGTSINNFVDASTVLSSKVFENNGVLAGGWPGCPAGATLSAGDERTIRVAYDLGGGYVAMSPDVPIASSAYAMVAESLQGKRPTDFINVRDDMTNDLNQANVENVFTSTNYARLQQLLNPTSAVPFAGQRLSNIADPSAASDAATRGYTDTRLGGQQLDLVDVAPGAGNGKVLTWDATAGKWVATLASTIDNTKLPLTGGTLTGNLRLSPNTVLNLGTVNNAGEGALGLGATQAGAIWYNTQTNSLRVWNGSAAVGVNATGPAGGDLSGSYPNPVIGDLAIGTSKIQNNAITSAKLNATGVDTNRLLITDSVTGATVTYANCANNEVLKYVTGTGWQCANVAALSAVTSVNGKSGIVVLNGADLGLGTASMRDVGVAATNVPELDGGGKLSAGIIPNFMGDISGAFTSAFVAGLQGRAVASTAPNANEVLRWNGTTNIWEPSVIVDNGITQLTGDISASGSGSVPATLTNGVVTTPKMFATPGANRLVATDGTSGATLVPFVCNLNESLQWTASGWACANPSTAFLGNNVIVDGGNARGAAISIGTTDNYAVNFKTNNTNKMTILPNGNVGIGTTAPSSNLDVVGSANISGTLNALSVTSSTTVTAGTNVTAPNIFATSTMGVGTSTPARMFEVAGVMRLAPSALPGTPGAGDVAIDSAAANTLKYHNGSSWVTLGTGNTASNGAANYISKFNGSNSLVNSALYETGGNVGVGTTSPSRLLSVNGSINVAPSALPGTPAAGDIAIDSGAANSLKYHNGTSWISLAVGGTGDFLANGSVPMTGQFRSINGTAAAPGMTFAGDTDNGIFAPTADNFAISTSGSEKLRVLANGNVGIGVSAPTQALDVAGNIRSISSGMFLGNVYVGIGSATSPSLSFLSSTASGMYSPTADNLGIATSGIDRVRVTSAGNVGIGTTSPGRLLSVNGSINVAPSALPGTPAAGDIAIDSAASNSLKYHNGTSWISLAVGGTGDFLANGSVPMTGQLRHLAGTAAAPGLTFVGDTDNGIFAPIADNVAISTGGVEKMRVLANGNVGIGTTAPTVALDVIGSAAVTNGLEVDKPNGSVVQTNGASYTISVANSANAGSNNWSGIGFKRNSASSPLAAVQAQIIDRNNNYGDLHFSTADTSGILTRMVVKSGGSVGIGTSTPSRLLSVNGSINVAPSALPGTPAAGDIAIDSAASNSLKYHNGTSWISLAVGGTGDFKADGSVAMTGQFRSINGTAAAPGMTFVGDTDNGIFAPAADNFAVSTSGSEKLRVLANGNVGIGTTSPGSKLQVDGQVSTNGNAFIGGGNGNFIQLTTNGGIAGGIDFRSGSNIVMALPTGGSPGTGNVGIGTTNPTSKLSVGGSPTDSVRFFYDNDDVGDTTNGQIFSINRRAAEGDGLLSFQVDQFNQGIIRSTDNLFLQPQGSGSIYLSTTGTGNYTPAMTGRYAPDLPTVWTSGGGGDGTGVQSVLSTSNTAGNSQRTYFGVVATPTGYSPTTVIGVQSAVNSYSERMRIDSNGNVGVGTTAPSRLLSVNGSINVAPSTLPGTPAAGDIAIDSAASNSLKYHNGTSWISLAVGGTGDFKADGSVAMTGQFRSINGTAAAPGMTFVGDTDNGIFAPAADNFAVSTSGSEKLRVLANGNVGVGTTNPTNKFQVEGTSFFNGGVTVGGDITSSARAVIGNGSQTVPSFSFLFSSTTGFYRPAADQIGVSLAGTERLRIDSFGNLGIGTTGPTRPLQVAGAMKLNPITNPGTPTAGDIFVDSSAANALKYHNGSNWVSIGSGSGDFMANGSVPMTGQFRSIAGTATAPGFTFTGDTDNGIYSPATDQWAVTTAGSQRLRVDANGRVGIGDTGGLGMKLNVADDLGPNVGKNWLGGFYRSSGSFSGVLVGYQADGVTDTGGLLYSATNLSLWTGAGVSASEKMRVSSNGFVGIGTTTPSRLLQVAGAMKITPTANPGTPTAGDIFVDSTAANSLKYHNGSAWVSLAGGGSPAGVNGQIQFNNAGAFGANASLFWDNSNAFLGLGTTTPIAELHAADPTGSTADFRLSNNTGSLVTDGFLTRIQASDVSLTNFENGSMSFGTNATERMRIDQNGNVGIGMTTLTDRFAVYQNANAVVRATIENPNAGGNASALLYVKSNAGAVGVQTMGTTANGGGLYQPGRGVFSADSGTGDLVITHDGIQALIFGTSGVERMRLLSDGKLGIGTSIPTRLFQVAGAMKITPTANPGTPTAGDIYVDSAAANVLKYHNGSAWISVGSGGGDFLANGTVPMTGQFRSILGSVAAPGMSFVGDTNTGVWSPGADTFAVSTNGAERIRVDSSGNLGVGTTNPSYLLHVASTGYAQARLENTQGGAGSELDIATYGAGGSSTIFLTSSRGTKAAPTYPLSGDTIGYIGASPNQGGAQGARVMFHAAANWAAGNTPGTLRFATTPAGASVPLDRVLLDQDGNLGVGTMTPTSSLHVESSSALTTGNPIASRTTMYVNPTAASSATYQGAGSDVYVQAGSSNITASVNGLGYYVQNNSTATTSNIKGVYGGVYNSSTGTVTNAMSIDADTANDGGGTITNAYGVRASVTRTAGTITNGFGLAISQVQATNKWSIFAQDSTAPSYFAGNIGIGTTAPTRPLQVVGAMKLNPVANPGTPTAGDIYVDSSAANVLKYHNGSAWVSVGAGGGGDFMANGSVPMTGQIQAIAGTNAAPGITFVGDTNTGIFLPATDNVAITTSGSEKMRVLANGNVGIGTASPNTLLEMVSPTYAEARLMNPTGGGAEFDVYNYGAGEPAFYVSRSNGTRLSPTYLTSGDGAGYFGWSAAHGTFGSAGRIRMIAAANWSDTSTPGDMALLTTPVGAVLPEERIRILENGNVGIGTTNPGSPLQVVGAASYGVAEFVGSGTDAESSIGFRSSNVTRGAAGNFVMGTNLSGTGVGTFSIYAAPAAKAFTMLSNGNIGIGMTNPSVALDVNGDIEYTGTITDVSDRRLKENITPLSDGLAMIRELPVYSYTMKGDEKARIEYGVMAQDLRSLVPNLTSVIDKEHGYIGVNYIGLIPWSIRAIQEVDREVASVKAENQVLKSRLDKLEEQNKVLADQVQKLIDLHNQGK